MHPHRLSNTQIEHNLFTTTGNSICSDVSIQPLDLGSLTTTAVTQTTKYLTSLSCAEFEGDRGLCFQASNRTTELEHSLHVAHFLALIDQGFEPGVRRLYLARHMCQFEPDDGMGDELLAESTPLVGVFDALFVADTGEANTLDDNANAFVVEVGLAVNMLVIVTRL